ncbi:hypothetical protein IscW_ISCW008338 [Ixodes scapularis]|uniref:Uncharacterized protein n=1 Tax=Ixodes scapularis TaxID=6945 RepID=B7PTM9_IXOSC|nr:hypothetical protein IscW_ISCW008338 [Ixodes scapularis]|eukprot:XP_002404721.1 hypothetical protein IscW_ISCW008338 [Ixodes scapularis]
MGTVNCTLRKGSFIQSSRADSSRHELPQSEAALDAVGQTSRKWWQTHFQSSPLPNFAESFCFYSQSCKLL